ncbi:MAG: AI-2E family transporter [Cyclobacteriaceae bacterium]|nr:AI-2E family transporter [Cyclobacteriaceae bacterium]
MKNANKIIIPIAIIATVIVLIYGQSILIPFILAIILWFLIRAVRNLYRKVPLFRDRLPLWLQNTVAAIMMFVLAGICIQLLTINIQVLSKSLPVYESNVRHIAENINAAFNIDIVSVLSDFSGEMDFTKLLSGLFSSLTNIFGNTFTILLYTLFLLLEESVFGRKLKAMYSDPSRYETINNLIQKVDKSVSSYITLKTIVSFSTGLFSYLALLFIGIDSPFFWAFFIFLLNYIPTIGSLIATGFPTVFALLQFGEFAPAIYVLLIVGAIQVVVGNIIEPKVMGNTLNVSSLVVLLALSFWGAIWGITGMILSVPVTVIIVIVCSEFPATRFIAVLLSEKGDLKGR